MDRYKRVKHPAAWQTGTLYLGTAVNTAEPLYSITVVAFLLVDAICSCDNHGNHRFCEMCRRPTYFFGEGDY